MKIHQNSLLVKYIAIVDSNAKYRTEIDSCDLFLDFIRTTVVLLVLMFVFYACVRVVADTFAWIAAICYMQQYIEFFPDSYVGCGIMIIFMSLLVGIFILLFVTISKFSDFIMNENIFSVIKKKICFPIQIVSKKDSQ